jgi:hypothetical protein
MQAEQAQISIASGLLTGHSLRSAKKPSATSSIPTKSETKKAAGQMPAEIPNWKGHNMKNQTIASDPEQLKARLNQPKTTLVEALRQVQATMPLAPRGLRELQQSKSDSLNGHKKTTA